MRRHRFNILLALSLVLAAWPRYAVAVEADDEFFRTQVKPLLQEHCLKCHGGEAKIKGGLRLTSRDTLLKGGDLGPVISTDDPAASLLLKAIHYKDDNLRMPPRQKLDDAAIAVLEQWVTHGAPWPHADAFPTVAAEGAGHAGPPKVNETTKQFWSFKSFVRPEVPVVNQAHWGRNPIDAFVLQKLQAAGLSPSPPADKTALIRRAYYDLTGLPPTPAEVEAFLKDASPDAYEKLIDQLLASPRYGEKWGRFWLDLVRFAETNSFERDGVKPFAWRYRDYVIESFNQDKPYDQFVREQIAGDELDEVTPQTIIATGYYRLGIYDDEPADKIQARYDELDDIVATTGQVFLGLTINCARCHDHKLDPIPQRDYYRLMAFFHNVKPYSNDEDAILTPIAPQADVEAYLTEKEARQRRQAELRDQIKGIDELVIGRATEEEKPKLLGPGKNLRFFRKKLEHDFGKEQREQFDAARKELEKLQKAEDEPSVAQALSVRESGPVAPPTHILLRGSAHAEGDEVQPGFPEVLGAPEPVFAAPSAAARSSGRRKALADWLTRRDNPLTARVMVNRIWQQHFGKGIVHSASDFGMTGDKPTHPELLNWLASEFVDRGWSMKAMHRLIMTSEAYRMGSVATPDGLAKDAGNDLLWRFDMRRLMAEEIRDSILAVSGDLNLKMGGPGAYPTMPPAVLAGQSVPGAGWGKSSAEEKARRSVYVHQKRSLVLPILASFDAADADFSCPVRLQTTQPTQALGMLNSAFMGEQAKRLAKRLGAETGETRDAQVRLGLRLTTLREPNAAQVERGMKLLESLQSEYKLSAQQALEQFALMVLNLNEFVYLD